MIGGDPIQLHVYPTSTIPEVKTMIQEKTQIEFGDLPLCFEEYTLKNSDTIQECGIKENSTLRHIEWVNYC